MNDIYDYAPFSKGRQARILEIYEAAYQYRKLPALLKNKKQIKLLIEKYQLSKSEVVFILGIINELTTAEIRKYLLDHGSSIVRVGKKTRPRKAVE